MKQLVVNGYPKFSVVPDYMSDKFVELVKEGYENVQFDTAGYLFKKTKLYFLTPEDINMYEVNDLFEQLCSLEVFKMWRPPNELDANEFLDFGICQENNTDGFINDIRRVLLHYNMSHTHNNRVINHPIGQVW
jgi:hypothetical protein